MVTPVWAFWSTSAALREFQAAKKLDPDFKKQFDATIDGRGNSKPCSRIKSF
jgi:hypothetical protein